MKYVLATSNPGKIAEMKEILSEFGVDVVTLKDLGIDVAVEETGTTFAENAVIKAKSICSVAGIPAIADDSGICIDALGGEPGVYSSSFGGEHLDDNSRCRHLLDVMRSVEQRDAKFVSTIVCAFPDGKLITTQGECRGKIATRESGTGGFGYDCVFIAEGNEMTMAQLAPDEKNAISHRGKALKEFSRELEASGYEDQTK